MSQSILTVVGYAVGYYFGGPVGGALGAALVGAATAPDIEGPRLSDTKVQISSYGAALPRAYGMMRLAGNVIWSTNLKETEEESGKGGGSISTFAYSVSCAVAICEGEICGINRVWADAKLVYDARAYASGESPMPQEDVDALEQSLKFARYMALYPGDENQLPDPTIEAIEGSGNVEAYRGTCYVVFTDLPLGDYGNRIPNFSFEVITKGTVFTGLAPWVVEPTTVRPAFGGVQYTVFNAGDPSLGDPDIVYQGSSLGEAEAALRETTFDWYNTYIGFWTSNNSLLSIFGPDAEQDLNTGGGAQYVYLSYNFEYPEVITYDYIGQSGESDQQWNPGVCATNELGYSPSVTKSSFPRTITGPEGAATGHMGTVRVFMTEAVPPELEPYSAANLAPIDIGFAANNIGCVSPQPPLPQLRFQVTLGIQHRFIRVERTDVDDEGSDLPPDSFTACTASTTYLSDVVADICRKAGLADNQFDVSVLASSVVNGYVIARQMSAREAIDPLRMAFFFDMVESGNVIKAVRRGGAPVASLTLDDIGAAKEGEQTEPVASERAQETQLPQAVAVNYFAKDASYQTGTQLKQRQATVSQQQVTAQLAVALSDQAAAEICDVLLYEGWINRNSRTISVTNDHAYLEPTDIVSVNDGNFTYALRIVEKTEQDGIITLSCVDDDAAVYSPNSTASETPDGGPGIRVIAATIVEFLDIPLVYGTEQGPGFYVAACGAKPETWTGAMLYVSQDSGELYTAILPIKKASVMGTCTTVLGDYSGGNTVDELNSFDVALFDGALSSITRAQLINGGNLFVVGNELVQAQRCELVGDLAYRMTGLLRGRFGTQQYMGTHAADERFVMLSPSTTYRVTGELFAVNGSNLYKAVTLGESLADTEPIAFTNTAAGLRPLSPIQLHAGYLSPGQYRVAWTRRSRIGQKWVDFIDTPLGETSESYQVTVLDDDGDPVGGVTTVSTPSIDIAASPGYRVRVVQMSSTVGRGFTSEVTI